MGRILFYVVILVAGAALAWLIADVFSSFFAADQVMETARDFSGRRPPSFDCDYGPEIFGLPVRQLAVGAVTTLFGIVMQGVIGVRRG